MVNLSSKLLKKMGVFSLEGLFKIVIIEIIRVFTTFFLIQSVRFKKPSTLPSPKIIQMPKHIVEYKGQSRDTTYQWITEPSKMGATSYIEGTRTSDTCRFAKTKNLPIQVTFTDACNAVHRVQITSPQDEYTISVMCNHELNWFGDEKDRTGWMLRVESQNSPFLMSQVACGIVMVSK